MVPITYLNYSLSSEALEVPLKDSTYLLTHRLTKPYMQFFHLDRQPRMKERWLGFLIWTGSGSLPSWALGYRHHHVTIMVSKSRLTSLTNDGQRSALRTGPSGNRHHPQRLEVALSIHFAFTAWPSFMRGSKIRLATATYSSSANEVFNVFGQNIPTRGILLSFDTI